MAKRYDHTNARWLLRSKVYEARHYDYDDRFLYIDIDGLEKKGKETVGIVEIKHFGETFSAYQLSAILYTADVEFKPPVPFYVLYILPDLSRIKAEAQNAAARELGEASSEREWLQILYKMRGLKPDEKILDKVEDEASRKEFLDWYHNKIQVEAQKYINIYLKANTIEDIVKHKEKLDGRASNKC